MPDDIRWICTYVLGEESGALGTVWIYQAARPEAVRQHAAHADLPADEIPVADTVVVRPDRQPAQAWPGNPPLLPGAGQDPAVSARASHGAGLASATPSSDRPRGRRHVDQPHAPWPGPGPARRDC